MRSRTAARRSIDRIDDAGCVSMRKSRRTRRLSLDTFRGTATARLELRRSKVGVGRADVISQRKVGDVVSRSRSQSAPSMRSARRRDAPALASTRSVAPASPARRRAIFVRPTAAPSAPLNFFSLPEPRAEGSEELGRRLGGVTHGTPMGTRNAPRAGSGPSRRVIFD